MFIQLELILSGQKKKKRKQAMYNTVTLALKYVSHPVLLFKLSKRNMVTFEGFLSEAACLSKKTDAAWSANI